jgi:hypothetical protein
MRGRLSALRGSRNTDHMRTTNRSVSRSSRLFQAHLDRFAAGLSLGVAYTFSKAIGLGENSSVFELPFGPGRKWVQSGIAGAIARGWQINGIFSAYSGNPFTVTSSATPLNAPGNSQVAGQAKELVQVYGNACPLESYFDPFAFSAVTGARFGNAGLNSLRGPGLVNLDFGIFRAFRVSERFQLQFRAEAFNATDTPHFNNPGVNDSSMLLNPDGSIRTLGGSTGITSARRMNGRFVLR